jgi:hypothetical protein
MDAVEQRVTWKQWLRDTASGAAGEAAQRAYSDGVALGVRMAAGEDVSNAEYDAAELAAGGDAEMFADGVAAGLGRAAESVAV